MGKPLRLEGSLAGWQALYWDNQLVSQLAASADPDGEKTHTFQLTANDSIITVDVSTDIHWQPFKVDYRVTVDGEVIESGSRNEKDIERQQPVVTPQTKPKFSVVGLASLGFKLLKSAKVIKVVLAGASVAA